MKDYSDVRVVAIGGGTGLSTMLKGVKLFTSNIEVIVNVSDDGGSSGMLREDMKIPPPGDIRNCIVALADAEDMLKKLFRYRFKCGKLKGHSFGNLFLAAMTEVTGDFETAIEKMSSVLAITGHVYPVTKDDINIKAILKNGTEVFGESKIPLVSMAEHSGIDTLVCEPKHVTAYSKCIDAIMNADVVILGPGSLYTSIIANLVVDGIADALEKTKAKKVYVCNVVSQPGETDGYTAFDHVKAIIDHSSAGAVDICIANNKILTGRIMDRYTTQGAHIIELDRDKFAGSGIRLVEDELLYIDENEKIRHDYIHLAEVILSQVR